ncbi:hypothetical protein L6303_06025 [archaeon]|nr:hypothetical protein [Nanoarchaeota archaeon]MBU4452142.1 hypothetical protein [Nanoarchaeota archaeon]MCG2724275.1 hypothetical protein [archaeon]
MQKIFVSVFKGWPERVYSPEDMRFYPLVACSKIALPPKMAEILINSGFAEAVHLADNASKVPIEA